LDASQIDKALQEAGSKGGFCTRLTGDALLKKYGRSLSAKTFADAVLYAEGLSVKYSDHRNYLEKIFSKYC